MTVPEIIAHASSLSVLVPLTIYGVRFRRMSKPLHIIGALLVVAACSDLAGFTLSRTGTSTAMVFNIYYSLMFLLLSWFYYDIFFKRQYQLALFVGVAVYVLAFTLITFYVQQFDIYQNLIWMIGGIIMILFSITCFVNSLSAIPTVHLFNNSTIWINTGVLFYFSLSIFLFSMGDYLFNRQDHQVTMLLWSTHNVNNFIKNVIFAIGLSVFQKPKPFTGTRFFQKESLVLEEN